MIVIKFVLQRQFLSLHLASNKQRGRLGVPHQPPLRMFKLHIFWIADFPMTSLVMFIIFNKDGEMIIFDFLWVTCIPCGHGIFIMNINVFGRFPVCCDSLMILGYGMSYSYARSS